MTSPVGEHARDWPALAETGLDDCEMDDMQVDDAPTSHCDLSTSTAADLSNPVHPWTVAPRMNHQRA